MIEYKHEYGLIVIYYVILPDGAFTSFKCPYCGFISVANNSGNLSVFSQGTSSKCNTTVQHVSGNQPMPPYTNKKKTARLIYEPSLQGYSLSFSYNRDIVEFIKKAIPSHKRTTSGPPDWTWYFGSEYFDLIKLLFDGHREYTLTIVSENEVKKKLEEAQNTQSSWAPAQYSIDAELQKFVQLLLPVSIGKNGDFDKEVKNWTKNDATKAYRRAAMFYHPDRNNGDGSKMSELNSTWAILKEGYYIK